MNNGFFAMLFRMKHIERWGIMNSLIPDRLSVHSLEVGFLAHALCELGNARLGKSYDTDHITVKAIFHDVPEIFTGDIPTPVKYFNSETKSAYAKVEEASVKKLTAMLPPDIKEHYEELFSYTDEERIIIKAADRISAYIKCLEEKRYGNTEFDIAALRLSESIAEMHCAEADIFLAEFMEAFGLPIDSILNENQ